MSIFASLRKKSKFLYKSKSIVVVLVSLHSGMGWVGLGNEEIT